MQTCDPFSFPLEKIRHDDLGVVHNAIRCLDKLLHIPSQKKPKSHRSHQGIYALGLQPYAMAVSTAPRERSPGARLRVARRRGSIGEDYWAIHMNIRVLSSRERPFPNHFGCICGKLQWGNGPRSISLSFVLATRQRTNPRSYLPDDHSLHNTHKMGTIQETESVENKESHLKDPHGAISERYVCNVDVSREPIACK